MTKKDFKIVFMGTPDFAVEALKELIDNNYNIVGVITSPDKPAGRGRKLNISAVKKYALLNNLTILQPKNLKAPEFTTELEKLNADLQIVVAFRMLPEIVWNMPRYGTFNLHASLLPQYRGAAPINWAIINGEKETGVTTFFIEHKIDTGNILFNEKVNIDYNDTAENLHDKLMSLGAKLVTKTVDKIIENDYLQTEQNKLISEDIVLKPAPKIYKNDCKINWDKKGENIYNFIRGLSPYPCAWTEFENINTKTIVSAKIYFAEFEKTKHNETIGSLVSDSKKYLKVAITDGYISIKNIHLAGKKRLNIEDFLRGFNLLNYELGIRN